MRAGQIKRLILGLGVLGTLGCGGGSAGTGTGARIFEGSVQESDGTALAGVRVTVVATQDSTVTDELGRFALETEVIPGDVELEVSGDQGSTVVVVPNVSDEPSTVNVQIEVPSDGMSTGSISVTNLEVETKIVGNCDVYFENNRIIRQSNKTPPNVTCLARSSVKGDGKTLGGVGVTIQVRKCAASSPWRTIAEGETMHGANSGIAQVPFTFIDNQKNCVYRVLAPTDVEGVEPIIYEIYTFTKQAYDKSREP